MGLIHPDHDVTAVSTDGVWAFRAGKLCSAGRTIEPPSIDCFERWTFARFMPSGELVLAFESGQPWGMGGSYGDPYCGVQVLARTGPEGWDAIALEYDTWNHWERGFVPDDAIWHPRGVLAWLWDDELSLQVLAAPPEPRSIYFAARRDSDLGLAWSAALYGSWRSLTIDDAGRMLTARGTECEVLVDLEQRRYSMDGGAWESLA